MESISSAGVVELRIHYFSKCDEVAFVVVGQVVECVNMSRGAHGASVEGADEEVCRVVGPALGWISPQRSSVAVSKES